MTAPIPIYQAAQCSECERIELLQTETDDDARIALTVRGWRTNTVDNHGWAVPYVYCPDHTDLMGRTA